MTDNSEVNDQQIPGLAILKEIRASDATVLAYSAPYKPSLGSLVSLIETEKILVKSNMWCWVWGAQPILFLQRFLGKFDALSLYR